MIQANEAESSNPGVDKAVFWVCLVLLSVGAVAFALFQYATPTILELLRNEDLKGLVLFSRHFGISYGSMALPEYIPAFTLSMVCGTGLCLCAATSALKIDVRYRMLVFAVIVLVNVATAILFPPAESRDVFNNVAFGREAAYYGLNPYTHSTYFLYQLHDPIAPYLDHDALCTTPYGPLWTLLSTALIALLRGHSIFQQIVAFKLVQAAAVVLAAEAARRYSARRNPSYGIPAMVAIGLNPLCLLEGPGNGHNDMAMMAAFMGALCLYDASRLRGAALLGGISIALKFVPLAALPLILIDHAVRGARIPLRHSIAVVALLFLPPALLMAPYWDHGAAVNGVVNRIQGDRTILLVKAAHATTATSSGYSAPHVAGVFVSEGRNALLYLVLMAGLIGRRKLMRIPLIRRVADLCAPPGTYPAWIVAWILLFTFQGLTMDIHKTFWFSWYYVWAILPAACLWTPRRNVLLACSMILALGHTLKYVDLSQR